MNFFNRKYIYILFSIFVTIIDFKLKLISISKDKVWGDFAFIKLIPSVSNYGLAGNLLKNDSIILNQVLVILVFFMLCSFFSLLFFTFRAKVAHLIVPVALFVIGAGANFTERIIHGYVTDYIQIVGFEYIFNLADFLQWPGLLLLVLNFIFRSNHIFPKKDRRSLMISKSIEGKSIFYLFLKLINFSMLSTMAISLLFFYQIESVSVELFYILGLSYLLVILLVNISSLIFVNILISRIQGPIEKFSNFIMMDKQIRPEKLSLRENDLNKVLSVLYAEINK